MDGMRTLSADRAGAEVRSRKESTSLHPKTACCLLRCSDLNGGVNYKGVAADEVSRNMDPLLMALLQLRNHRYWVQKPQWRHKGTMQQMPCGND